MQHQYAIEAVECTIHEILSNDYSFEGITALFGGDIRQTLSVVPHGTQAHIVGATLCRSSL